jgi:hypothetical protein
MKKYLIQAIIMATCFAAQAQVQPVVDSKTFRITSDGPSNPQIDISTIPSYSASNFSNKLDTEYDGECSYSASNFSNKLVISKSVVSTGTSISLKELVTNSENVTMVSIMLTHSKLNSFNTFTTVNCKIQIPSIDGFTSSSIIPLKLGVKTLIKSFNWHGENWFIERIK